MIIFGVDKSKGDVVAIVTVNAGEQYQACVLPVKTLEPICTTGNNSPAARPEFVDLSLNATTEPTENGLPEDEGGEEE